MQHRALAAASVVNLPVPSVISQPHHSSRLNRSAAMVTVEPYLPMMPKWMPAYDLSEHQANRLQINMTTAKWE